MGRDDSLHQVHEPLTPNCVGAEIQRIFGPAELRLHLSSRVAVPQFKHQQVAGMDVVRIGYGTHARVLTRYLHAAHHLHLVLQGRCWIRSERGCLTLTSGDAAVINNAQQIEFEYSPDCIRLLVRIPNDDLFKMASALGYISRLNARVFDLCRHRPGLDSVLSYAAMAVCTLEEGSGERVGEQLKSIIVESWIHGFSNAFEHALLTRAESSCVVNKVRLLVMKDAGRKISVDQLCELCGVSRKKLYEIFQREIGMSPNRYVQGLKLEMARDAIQDPSAQLNITQVAFQHGFSSPGRFSKQYRDYFGLLPSQTR